MKAGPVVMSHHVRAWAGSGASLPPLDSLTNAIAAYGLRKLSSAYAGQAIRLRRASDNLELNIGFIGNDLDTAAATTHCNATSCFVRTWFDQSGVATDMAQVVNAQQPAFQFSCLGSAPCVRLTLATQTMAAPTVTPVGSAVSFSTVSRRVTGTGACILITENSTNNRFMFNSVANSYFMAATGNMTGAQTENTWHGTGAAINGASSFIAVDNTVSTGTVTKVATAAAPNITGAASTTCYEVEAIVWDNFAMSQAQATALTASQKTYWGF